MFEVYIDPDTGKLFDVSAAKKEQFLLDFPNAVLKEQDKENKPGKKKATDKGASVGKNQAPKIVETATDSNLENGSLELEEISLKEKKSLPYNVAQKLIKEKNFTRKRVKEVTDELNKPSMGGSLVDAIKSVPLELLKGVGEIENMIKYGLLNAATSSSDLNKEEKNLLYKSFTLPNTSPSFQNITPKLQEALKNIEEDRIITESTGVSDALAKGNYKEAAFLTTEGIIKSSPSIAAAFLGPAGMIVYGATVAGNKFDEEYEKNPEEASASLLGNAIATGALQVGSDYAFGKILKTAGVIKSKGDAKQAVEFLKTGWASIANKLKSGVIVAGGEGTTEVVQDLAQKALDIVSLDRPVDLSNITYELIDSFILGGIMGAGVSAVANIAQSGPAKKSYAEYLLMPEYLKENIKKRSEEINQIAAQIDINENPISKEIYLEKIQDIQNSIIKDNAEYLTGLNSMNDLELKSYATNKDVILKTKNNLKVNEDPTGILSKKIDNLENQNNDILEIAAERKLDDNIRKTVELSKKSGIETKVFNTKEESLEFLNNEKSKGNKDAISVTSLPDGFITQNETTGKQTIYIDKVTAKETKAVTVGSHELLHGILFNTIKNKSENAINLGESLLAELLNIDVKKINDSEFSRRLKLYKNSPDAVIAEEVITLFSDALSRGYLSYDESIFTKIGDNIRRVLQNVGFKQIKFDSGKDVYNFVKDYNNSFEKGIFKGAISKGLEQGFKGNLISENLSTKNSDVSANKESKSTGSTEKQAAASEKVQKLYGIYSNPETTPSVKSRVEGDIAAQFMGSVNKIVSGYRDRPGFKTFEEDLVVDVVTQAGGLLTLIRKYDPSKNDSLAAFVNTYLKVRAIPIINKTLGIDEASTFKSDVTEVKDVTATESAEDSINASEEIAKEKPKKEKVKLKDKLNFDKELNEIISKNLVKSIALNVKKFDETSTKNRTISPFVADIKMDLANFLEKDIAKNIKETGAESFLIENRDILLDNFTTTFLAKHPFFRKGILKRVNGVWTPPVRISEYLYKWVDKNGNALKIDRDNASERGLTSGPEFIKRNPDIKTVLKENEFVDYHFQDGALRKKIKSNPISSVARQIASEYSLEILQEDLLKEGPLTEELRQRADLVGVVMATNDTIEIAKSIDRGLIKFSSTLSEGAHKNKVAELEEFMLVNMAKGVDFLHLLTENTETIPPEHKSRFEEFKDKFNSLANLIAVSYKSNEQFKWFKKAGYKYIGSKNDALESIEDRLKELIQSKSNAWLHSKKSMQKAYGLTDTSLLTLNKRNFIESTNAFHDVVASSLIEENASKEERMAAANFMVSLGAGRKVQNMSSYWENSFFPFLKELGIEEEYTLIALQPFNGKNGKKVFPFTIGDKNGKKIKIITTQETISGEIQTSIQNAKMNINVEAQNAQSNYAKEAIAFFEKYMIKGLHGKYPSIAPSHLFVLVKAMQADMSSAIKVLAPVSFIYLNESRDYQDYTFEHMIAANTVGNYLINHILQNTENSKNELANVIKYYKVAIVPKTFANIVDKFYRSSLESGFDILGYLYDARYFAEAVKAYAEGKGIIVPYNMESFISVENTPKGNTLPRNKTIKETKTLYSISLPQPQSHKSMNSTINEMIERKEGVLATEVISTQTAQLQGRPKGKLDVFVPPSAEDFLGLLYKFLGAGKQGDADMAFFKGKLLRPIARASFLLNLERQALKAKYASLIKNNKGILPLLREESVYKYYSNDHAVRVFMWDKLGYDIPGLLETDKTALIKAVKNSPKLLKFASEAVSIPNKKESWLKPNEYWAASNLESDLQETISKTGRARLFNEFIENSKIIFSKDNLNKIEAIYGQDFRSNLEDIIYRISKGKSREIGSKNKITNTLLNWIRGSVATTMFLNTRTAVTQQLSFVNFMNWSDNNPLEAGKAFANTKQWAKDWTFLFNSDWMKERRQGLKTDINESELIAALQGTNNRYAALMRTVLSKGFIFTKYGDNIAVANGGASFYRNRINKYIKEGKSENQAQKLAFLDFQEIAEETQQSTRQDLLSNQQVTVAGRLFLAFANTSMQYTRLTKKAALDLINGRGDWKSNVSKIVFYSTVQNIIFSALQNALFAVTFWDDDDIDKDKMIDAKTERVINNVVDGLLKGTGITGSIVATLKNVVIKIMKEQEKGWKGNDAYILLEAANIAPPVGIKARKLYGAYTNYKFNKGLMDYIGYDNPKHPAYQITGAVASGAFNIPLDRLISKVSNLKDAAGSEAEAWQRIALVAGWGGWELGMKDAETEKARATKGKGAEEGRTSTRTSTRKSTRKSTRE